MWEWNRLRALDALSRTGSVREAATLLGMSGPAVSQQLRRLEAEAGVKVVEPCGRGIRLTSEGEVLARYAGRVAALMQEADNAVHARDPLAGVVRIGAVASAVRTVLTTELADLRAAHPGVDVFVEDGEAVDHVRRLAEGHLDLVIAESWSPTPVRFPAGLTYRRLAREEAYIALPAGHPGHTRAEVDLRDLEGASWATCPAGSDPHVALTQIAHSRGVDVDVRFHVADHVTQIELVRAGLAVACVPASARRYASDDVTFLPLAEPLWRELVLATNRRSSSRAVLHLADRLARLGDD